MSNLVHLAQPKEEDVIFFGNGPLADYALSVLNKSFNIIFHAKTKDDLTKAAELKAKYPKAHAILASFGILIKSDFLQLWEPEGILNLHPSLLPNYRGASPIETAILNGDQTFSVSIMKLVRAMDAGPVYYQETLPVSSFSSALPTKDEIYHALATTGANWLIKNLNHLPTPTPQQGEPTFTKKFDKTLSLLLPARKTATELLNEVRAFAGFPKSKYTLFDLECTILSAHCSPSFPENVSATSTPVKPHHSDQYLYATKSSLALKCSDGNFLILDQIQPAGKRPMDAKSFLNGYRK